MASRWIYSPNGDRVINHPDECAACGWRWPIGGPGSPHFTYLLECDCPTGTSHWGWICAMCNALIIEGCTDSDKIREAAAFPPEARVALPPELMDEIMPDWPDG